MTIFYNSDGTLQERGFRQPKLGPGNTSRFSIYYLILASCVAGDSGARYGSAVANLGDLNR